MLWFRKVILFDSLLSQHPHDEVVAIVNREFGHVALNHPYKKLVMSLIQLIVMFSFFGLVLGNKGVLQAFGFQQP